MIMEFLLFRKIILHHSLKPLDSVLPATHIPSVYIACFVCITSTSSLHLRKNNLHAKIINRDK